MRNKRGAILTPIILFLFVGCNAFDRSRAIIEYVCPVGRESHFNLSLLKKTGKLMFGHSGLGFIIETYDFTLAKKPEAYTVFTTTDLILTSENSRTQDISHLTSGQIVVDLKTRKVSVSLMTRNGPFPGNGEYSLHYIE
jgi:hypothetical protein